MAKDLRNNHRKNFNVYSTLVHTYMYIQLYDIYLIYHLPNRLQVRSEYFFSVKISLSIATKSMAKMHGNDSWKIFALKLGTAKFMLTYTNQSNYHFKVT